METMATQKLRVAAGLWMSKPAVRLQDGGFGIGEETPEALETIRSVNTRLGRNDVDYYCAPLHGLLWGSSFSWSSPKLVGSA